MANLVPERLAMARQLGAPRYYSDRCRDGLVLECRAIRNAREEIGLDSIIVMVPFRCGRRTRPSRSWPSTGCGAARPACRSM
ncbi:hypothetical protein [Dankookia sp. P2]|uniref:hypothetical protein n=1 Tax=Dankookia sp. P2 TaxID=3423955 RepID=UPI003D664DA8